MRVAIAGGHGKVALRLTRLLVARGDEVRSIVRRPEHAGDIRAAGAEPAICDLERASLDEVLEAIDATDAIVFAAGAGPGSGPDRKWTVDYGAAVKLIEAAHALDVRRYVMLSSIGADPEHPGDDTFSVYLRAKGQADADLAAAGLDHTIVRPAHLTDDPGTGRVHAAEHVGGGSIPRDDVAAVLAAVLAHPDATTGVVFEVTEGHMPVEDAIAALARRGV
jgi:uncharacterized protein YbjT (DUF2867 family)